MKFLDQSQSMEVTRTVAPQLVAMKKYSMVRAGSCSQTAEEVVTLEGRALCKGKRSSHLGVTGGWMALYRVRLCRAFNGDERGE